MEIPTTFLLKAESLDILSRQKPEGLFFSIRLTIQFSLCPHQGRASLETPLKHLFAKKKKRIKGRNRALTAVIKSKHQYF